jgi:transposase
MDVLWLKSQGLAHKDICRLAGVSANTLREYFRMYQSGGVQALTVFNFYAPTSELEEHRHRLQAYFHEHPPATLNEAAAKIEELTGIKRSPSAVGNFLRSLGMAPRRVGTIPSKADPEEQERFRINELEPRLEEAKQGERAIFLSMPLISS